MYRRRFLRALAGSAIGLTAGCLAAPPAGDRSRTRTSPERIARRGSPADICDRSIRPSVAIHAIDDPAFGSDWSGITVAERYGDLPESATVVGVDRADRPRAYPLSVLAAHEVVNDRLDVPLLVTYCPLCRSALVADRRIDGQATTFRVSGLLWRPPAGAVSAGVSGAAEGVPTATVEADANLVMYDERTGSYWSQLLAVAICGPLRGRSLSFVPYTVTSWGEWRARHPGTEVLLPPPVSST